MTTVSLDPSFPRTHPYLVSIVLTTSWTCSRAPFRIKALVIPMMRRMVKVDKRIQVKRRQAATIFSLREYKLAVSTSMMIVMTKLECAGLFIIAIVVHVACFATCERVHDVQPTLLDFATG